ncbi:hypothetical protein SAMN04515658_10549 [Idiomarina zobellii]|nr:hypothetical protein SAMN04515658_10549 [Idiomarina zobellii]
MAMVILGAGGVIAQSCLINMAIIDLIRELLGRRR